jgi:hypothetical protein
MHHRAILVDDQYRPDQFAQFVPGAQAIAPFDQCKQEVECARPALPAPC